MLMRDVCCVPLARGPKPVQRLRQRGEVWQHDGLPGSLAGTSAERQAFAGGTIPLCSYGVSAVCHQRTAPSPFNASDSALKSGSTAVCQAALLVRVLNAGRLLKVSHNMLMRGACCMPSARCSEPVQRL